MVRAVMVAYPGKPSPVMVILVPDTALVSVTVTVAPGTLCVAVALGVPVAADAAVTVLVEGISASVGTVKVPE